MLVKFKILFDDGTFLESHDKAYNQIKDHCHALPPNSYKKWHRYELITDEGQFMWVDYKTGLFNINGQLIHPADEGGNPLTNKKDLQKFETIAGREILNGLPYYPIFGTTMIFGDWGQAKIHFMGWKRKEGQKTIMKILYLYPQGQIVLT